MLLPATLPSVKWTLIGVWGWWGSWPDTNEPLELPDIPDDEKDVILPPNDESVGVNVRSLQENNSKNNMWFSIKASCYKSTY